MQLSQVFPWHAQNPGLNLLYFVKLTGGKCCNNLITLEEEARRSEVQGHAQLPGKSESNAVKKHRSYLKWSKKVYIGATHE